MTKSKKQKNITSEDLQSKEDLQQKCGEYLAGWQRAQADYENLKRQSEKEKMDFVKFANLNLIMNLIPIYNNFKISFDHLNDDLKNNEWVKGVGHIKEQMKKFLQDNGVEEIVPKVGDKFDPQLHEAMQHTDETQINSDDPDDLEESHETDEKISKVLSCGYKMNEKVIMASKVVVK